jgi:hypothetical protein
MVRRTKDSKVRAAGKGLVCLLLVATTGLTAVAAIAAAATK